MDLSTTYLGLELPHPLMPGASPLVDDLDTVRRLEDAGAAAIVMHSLFEEQVVGEQRLLMEAVEGPADSYAEALSYLPDPRGFPLGTEEYLLQVRRIKDAVGVPVIASLNGVSARAWMDYPRLLAQAGADALELNAYHMATDPYEPGEAVEQRLLEAVRAVKEASGLPLAVKLSPFYSSLAHLARRLCEAGADGLVLFNRFYQPDIDLEELEVVRTLELSTPWELRLRLRWLAALSGRVPASLACSGGVHDAAGALKAVMAGAHAVQLVSALLRRGPGRLREVLDDLRRWLEDHEYESLRQAQGSMNLLRCPSPMAYERANYVRILQSWEGRPPLA